MKWALHNLECLDIFAKNRVFLIGDAVRPDLGQVRVRLFLTGDARPMQWFLI